MNRSGVAPPWSTGDVDLADDVYEALMPLDGFPKGTRGGPRPYTYNDRWWVVVALSDFGDLRVGQWGPLAPPEFSETMGAEPQSGRHQRRHNHMTRDIKSPGTCPGCDRYWEGRFP